MRQKIALSAMPTQSFLICISCFLFACSSAARPIEKGTIPPKAESTTPNILWVTEEQGLRMRDVPSTSGKQIALLPYASKVEVLSTTGESLTIAGATGKWTEVKWNDKKGWVFGGFLGSDQPSSFVKGGGDIVAALSPWYEKWAREHNTYNADTVARIVKYGLRVEQQDGNFIVVSRLRTNRVSAEDTSPTNSLWVKVAGGWKLLIEDYEDGWGLTIKLGYLNKDKLVDAVVVKADESGGIDFYLGKSAYDMKMIESLQVKVDTPSEVVLAPCDSMTIRGTENINNDMKDVVLSFDCARNRVKKVYR